MFFRPAKDADSGDGGSQNPRPLPRISVLGVKKGNFSTGNAKNNKRETEVSRGSVNFALPMYNQLTLAQRYTIFSMRQNNSSLQEIADELNRIECEAASEKGISPSTETHQRLDHQPGAETQPDKNRKIQPQDRT